MLNLELLIIICPRHAGEDFVRLCQSHALPITLAALGRGTASREILDTLGLHESEKAIIFSVATSDKIQKAIKHIRRNLGIQSPGTSIVLSVPLSSVGGQPTARFFTDNQQVERKEYQMSDDQAYELIIVITTEGYSNLMMDAARTKGGATGGTILHARGLGMEEAQKFFGISLSAEKEMIFIACKNRCRNKIMQAVIDESAKTPKAHAITFSVPVSSVAGLWMMQDED
jgi:hypothetical protein